MNMRKQLNEIFDEHQLRMDKVYDKFKKDAHQDIDIVTVRVLYTCWIGAMITLGLAGIIAMVK